MSNFFPISIGSAVGLAMVSIILGIYLSANGLCLIILIWVTSFSIDYVNFHRSKK